MYARDENLPHGQVLMIWKMNQRKATILTKMKATQSHTCYGILKALLFLQTHSFLSAVASKTSRKLLRFVH